MKTNRRNFIKNISCLLGGVLASISGFVSAALPGVSYPKRSGTKFIAEIPQTKTPPWKKLGCKDCFKECEYWDECFATLSERVKARQKGEDVYYYGWMHCWMDDWDGLIVCYICSTKDCSVRDYATKVTNYPEHNIHDKLVAPCGWPFLYGKWTKQQLHKLPKTEA